MKFKLILSAFVLMLTVSMAYASFPVKRAAATNTENVTTTTDSVDVADMTTPAARGGQQSMGIALILWFLLGGLAGHRWYLKSPAGWNILFILTLGGIGIWWIIDGIDILTENYPNANFKGSFF